MKEKCTALVKARDKKGFTLMEMLIVVAIIAVLIAIAIPTFSSQLNKAKAATDQANVRSAYAVMQTCKLLDQDPAGTAVSSSTAAKWYMQKDGSFATTTTNAYKLQTDGTKVETVIISNAAFSTTKDNYIVINYSTASGFTLDKSAT